MRRICLAFMLVLVSSIGGVIALDDQALNLEMKNARTPLEGVITGGQPSMDDLLKLKEQGVRTIISLRRHGETTKHDDPEVAKRFNFPEADLADELGLGYISIPISSKDGLTRENAIALDAALTAAGGPVLLHCGSGNRAGAMLALRAFYVQGKKPQEALEIGLQAGMTSLEPKVRAILGLQVQP